MSDHKRPGFWREAVALQGSIMPRILPQILLFGLLATVVGGLARVVEEALQLQIELDFTPFEFAGAVLGVLLVFRTNAGYERWWEARKLWGGLVDRSRNLVVSALAYGPTDEQWRQRVVRLTASYPHVVRHTLRGEPLSADVARLVGEATAQEISAAAHAPSFVAWKLAELLREACERWGMDRFVFLRIDRERGLLIDNFGGCERILNTPAPQAYSLKIRHFLMLYLLLLPLTLLHRFDSFWLLPAVTMLVAYPLLSLDELGIELQNPFSTRNLSHLPLEQISATIERNALGLLQQAERNHG
jgi:putative membrane protein